ncbi:splicing factor, proline- and glutamine-rich-like [Caloenas nicobarica]|uniref:splicing factor, proline- and glutamine-rich-like n=1 Tax=Caloenas nicobarica TaxID=187106 RepID=UPI0032B764F4
MKTRVAIIPVAFMSPSPSPAALQRQDQNNKLQHMSESKPVRPRSPQPHVPPACPQPPCSSLSPAAMQVQEPDEAGGNGYPASWLDVVSEPLRYPAAKPVGEADPGSHLHSRNELPGHAVGLPRPMYEAEGGKKSPDPSKVLRPNLNELHRAHETHREAVQKEAFPEGSRGSLPGSPEAAEVMPAGGMPGLPKPGGYQRNSINEFRGANSDVVGKRTTAAPSPKGSASVLFSHIARKHCMLNAIATLISMPLAIVLFCIVIWQWRTAKKLRNPEAAARQAGRSQPPLTPEQKTQHCGTPDSCAQNQQPLIKTGKMVNPPSPQLLCPPSTSPAALQ